MLKTFLCFIFFFNFSNSQLQNEIQMALARTPEFLRSFEFKNLLKDNWKPADKLVLNDPNTNKKDEHFQSNWELPSNYLLNRGYIDILSKREENSTAKPQSPVKEKKSFLEKIKDAWIRFVHKNKNKTISLNNHTEPSISPSQSFLNFLYDDDSWLKDTGESLTQTTTEIPHENTTTKNDQTIFQNLTESDVDFLKKIINCFKKNKEIVTEHFNEENRKTGNGIANKSNENVNFSNSTTERPSIINVTTATTTTTAKPATEPPIYENCSQSKFNFTLNNTIEVETKIDPNQEEFISTGDCFNKSEDSGITNEFKNNNFENKIKFLAHLHHSVYEVGKLSNGHIDLERIQELIDDAKRNLNLRNFSEFDETIDNNFENSNFRTKRKSNEEDFSKKIKRIISDVSSKLNNSKPESHDTKKVLNEKSNLRTKKKSKKNDLPDYKEDAELFGWLKKKKRRKKNKKKKKEKHYRDKTEPEALETGNESFNDFDNIKFHVTPEQEEDINSFMKVSNSPPERFQFDVDKFIAKKSTFDKHSMISTEEEPTSQKRFYEFDYPAEQPDENIDSVKKTSKRDVMTQRLKAIANKIYSNSFEEVKLNQRDTNSELPYNDEDENSSNEVVSTSTQRIDDSYDFVDKFYLLNDGNTKLEENDVKNIPLIDPLDVNIDLELNEKFKELKLENDKSFYSDLRDKKSKDSLPM